MSKYIIAQTSDGQKLAPGDVMQFDPDGTFSNAATINAPSASLIGSEYSAHIKVPSPKGRNIDCVAIAKGVTSAKVQGIAAEITGSHDAAAVNVSGDKCVLRNISQVGEGRILTVNGATNLDAGWISDIGGTCGAYGIFGSFPAAPGTDNHLYGFDIRVSDKTPDSKVHAARIGHQTRLVLGDNRKDAAGKWLVTLPDDSHGKGFSGYLEHDSRKATEKGVGAYYGSAGNFKEVHDGQWLRYKSVGSFGLMAGLDADEPGHPDWRFTNAYFEGCWHDVINFFSFGYGVDGVVLKHGVIRAIDRIRSQNIHGACLEVKGPFNAWPEAKNIRFEDYEFFGDQLTTLSNLPNLKKNVSFLRCKFNGKPI